jgi:hypothetical protein
MTQLQHEGHQIDHDRYGAMTFNFKLQHWQSLRLGVGAQHLSWDTQAQLEVVL